MIRPTKIVGCLRQKNEMGYPRIERYVLNLSIWAAAIMLIVGLIGIPFYQGYLDFKAKRACEAKYDTKCVQQTVYVPKQEAEPQQ